MGERSFTSKNNNMWVGNVGNQEQLRFSATIQNVTTLTYFLKLVLNLSYSLYHFVAHVSRKDKNKSFQNKKLFYYLRIRSWKINRTEMYKRTKR